MVWELDLNGKFGGTKAFLIINWNMQVNIPNNLHAGALVPLVYARISTKPKAVA